MRLIKIKLCIRGIALALVVSAISAQAGFRFVVWGDATDLLAYVETNSTQIRALSVQPSFNLFLGDLYDTGFNLTAVEALQKAMDGVSSNQLSGTMFPIRGNHDITGGTNATIGWQSYFDMSKRVSGGDPSKGVPGIGGSNYTCQAGMDSLTYSFDYQNAHFVGMDIPGDVTLVKSNQLSWLDEDLAAAELRGLQHAFLYWHGPVYSCGNRHGGINAPTSMMAVLNKHPIVSAIFGGHAHVFAWTHMYTNRIASITHPFEAFIVPPVAESLASLTDSNRCDAGVGDIRGFCTVDVDGSSFALSLYIQDEPVARFRKTFPVPARLTSMALQTNGSFNFMLRGEMGCEYLVDVSTNLGDWATFCTNTVNAPEGSAISELVATNSLQRFFRCRPAR